MDRHRRFAAGAMRRCRPSSLQGAAAKHAASHDRTASAADGKLGGDPAETGRGSGAGDGGGRPCASGDFCPAAGGGGAAAKPPHGGRRSCMDSIPAICPPPKRYCAHPVADAILSEKLALCRGESITADCQVQIPEALPIPGAELCAVLGNLMDNAIEACRRLPEGTSRRITARGRVNGGFLVLRVQNPVSGEENNIPVGGALLDHHGWGLSIVRQIAERRRRTADHGALGRTVYLHGVAWRGGVSKHAGKKAFSLRFGRMLFSFTAGWPDNPYMPPAFFCGMPG